MKLKTVLVQLLSSIYLATSVTSPASCIYYLVNGAISYLFTSKTCIPGTIAVFFFVNYFSKALRDGEQDERIARGKAELERWRR